MASGRRKGSQRRRSAAGTSDLGATLRAARLRAGLSQMDLSARLGISQEPVSAAELGRLPRHTTLMAYLSALPWLSAHDVLPKPDVPRAASPGAWQRLRDVFGFSARSCRVELFESAQGLRRRVRVEGVTAAAAPSDAPVLRGLVTAVACGPATWMRDASVTSPAEGDLGPLVFKDAIGEHRVSVTTTRGRSRVLYEMEGPAAGVEPFSHLLEYPVERLELVVPLTKGATVQRARAWVRPETVPLGDALPGLAKLMYPRSFTPRVERTSITWTIERPLPGFVYGMEPGAGPVVHRKPEVWSLAGTLRKAREAANLSLRDVAERARVCHASVSYAEGGRDPRLGTLAGYLVAIPGLSPQELLPASCSDGSLTTEETWDLLRDIYGYEVKEIRKTLTIAEDGSSTNVVETLGLRPLRADLREMRVRTGLQRAVANAPENVLLEVESDLAELRVRRIEKTDGAVVHEFSFPTRLAQGTLSHARRYHGSRFPLRRSASRKRVSAAVELYSGAGLPILHPVETAVLQVILPGGCVPPWARATAWPTCLGPDRDRPPLSSELSAVPCRVRVSKEVTSLTARVQRPLIGTTLSILWGVPEG